MEPPIPSGRDPVAKNIEVLLHNLEQAGKGALTKCGESAISLDFGGIKVEAPDHDVALIRLATAMLDDHRYCRDVVEALRGGTGILGQVSMVTAER